MSDDWIILIPEDPRLVPSPQRQQEARRKFLEIAPGSDEFKLIEFDAIQFFDCGVNFERIVCPSCEAEIAFDWWEARLGDDLSEGFAMASYPTPCCGSRHTLQELTYEWPLGFGRFGMSAKNANIGRLTPANQRELEKILGTPLRVIYRHS